MYVCWLYAYLLCTCIYVFTCIYGVYKYFSGAGEVFLYLSDTSSAPEKPDGKYLKTPCRPRRSIRTHFSGAGEVLIYAYLAPEKPEKHLYTLFIYVSIYVCIYVCTCVYGGNGGGGCFRRGVLGNVWKQLVCMYVCICMYAFSRNLESLLAYDNDCSKEIGTRVGKATGVMPEFKNIWKSKNISSKTKRYIVVTQWLLSVVLYACEAWTMKKREKNKLMAFEMRCYQRILSVRWRKSTNEELRKILGCKRNIIQRN